MDNDQPLNVDVCILGAGPHGLAAAVHLLQAKPSIQLRVVDPSGDWLSAWDSGMASAEIETLRSPIVHSPSPNASALSHYITEKKFSSSGLPYDIPTVKAFASFCDHLVNQATLEAPTTSRPKSISYKENVLHIETDDQIIRAKHLIIAANPHHQEVPHWALPLCKQSPDRFTHTSNLDLRSIEDLSGEQVVVIGAGLSAAHLVCGAAKRGANVKLIARRSLQTRNFDVDPGWLGPKYLQAFGAETDPAERLKMVKAARGGGTIPPWKCEHLDNLISDGTLEVHENTQVFSASAEHDGSCFLALTNDTSLKAERVWFATGTTPNIASLRCLDEIITDVPFVENYPILEKNLRLGDHPIHVMGRLAMLSLGPAAGNLWGAQRAAERITKAIIDSEPTSSKPSPHPLYRKLMSKEMSV